MKITLKVPAVVIALLFLCTSCATMFDKTRSVDTQKLRIGMTKDEVQFALNKKYYEVVAAQKDNYSNKVIEVVQYSNTETGYWLYFIDGKLDRWEPADPKHKPLI